MIVVELNMVIHKACSGWWGSEIGELVGYRVWDIDNEVGCSGWLLCRFPKLKSIFFLWFFFVEVYLWLFLLEHRSYKGVRNVIWLFFLNMHEFSLMHEMQHVWNDNVYLKKNYFWFLIFFWHEYKARRKPNQHTSRIKTWLFYRRKMCLKSNKLFTLLSLYNSLV